MTRVLIGAIAIGFTLPISAFDPERALENLANELAACAGYYSLIINLPDVPAGAQKHTNDAGTKALSLAIELADEKRAMATMAIKAQEMAQDMGRDWGNVDIVMNEWDDLCKDLLRDPDARLEHWLKMED